MTHSFDKAYWQQHWQQTHGDRPGSMAGNPPNPYLAQETAGLAPGTALDAGCGAGAEAIWLASHGWQVTAADISADALTRAADRATASGLAESIRWVEADLTAWEPGMRFDLVTTHYAHPAMPQLAFYQRIGDWVTPGGILLIVGHLHTDHGLGLGLGHHHPAEATVTLADITAGLDTADWQIVTAEEHQRPVPGPGGQTVSLHDVVVRATRRR
ncbi:class I SAM-dependent methyltransferase [Micromonospora sp. GCM10011542]|uniref:class I SAM-dependent methyltransferase n=1 Tax=Micromonospora sp. GCM10011542 TaxID=3317337 RepID=UPI0036224A7B